MDLSHFKQQHVRILTCIAVLRRCAKTGVAEHAAEIARLVIEMSSVVKLHLAAEDRTLYPALRSGEYAALASMGRTFEAEMADIVAAYVPFSRHWNTAAAVRSDPEGFRADANLVLRRVHERVQRENLDFYPAIERATAAHGHA